MHPSRCLVMCILRGAVFCASFEVPCFVHPSRCLVMCILRGAVFCAFFEVPYFVHPSRCLVMCILRGDTRKGFVFWKNVSPLPNELLPGGSLCRKVSSLWWNFDRPFGYHRGNARKFRVFEKTSPPFLARCCLRVFLFFLLCGSSD